MEINTPTTSIVAHPNFPYFRARYCSSLTFSIRSTIVLLFPNGDARHSRGWRGTHASLISGSYDASKCDHERRSQAFARRISNDQRKTVLWQADEVRAVPAQGSNLAATRAIVYGVASSPLCLLEPLPDEARQYPVLAPVHHHFAGCRFLASTRISVLGCGKIDKLGLICALKGFLSNDVEKSAAAPTTR
jgi:hypothetical protein